MKLETKSNLHLTYCTNIHSGESWQEVEQNLKQYIPPLKARLSPNKSFGIGLRLADAAAWELFNSDLDRFQAWLQAEDLYVFTLNGFPYGGFHNQVVKDKVYAPDWSHKERLDYTLTLIEILTCLLPEGMDGGISTVPISYKPWWQSETEQEEVFKKSCWYLAHAIAKMAETYKYTGKLLHLDLEPEPDGMLENTAELINFWQNWLYPVTGKYLQQQYGINRELATSWISEHIRVCYDTCHFAVEYEEPQDIIRRLRDNGIKIGKIQLSSAIKIDIPQDKSQREQIINKLAPFAESTYLHQVIARNGSNFSQYRDLEIALKDFLATEAQEWRTHFHVPIFIHNYQLFESTQDHIAELLKLLPDNDISHHLEIETYTWEVLPPEMKLDILTSIEREYQWILNKISF